MRETDWTFWKLLISVGVLLLAGTLSILILNLCSSCFLFLITFLFSSRIHGEVMENAASTCLLASSNCPIFSWLTFVLGCSSLPFALAAGFAVEMTVQQTTIANLSHC